MKSFLFCSTTAVLVFALATSVWAEPPKDFTNSIGMKFKLIPAGQFMMGSSESAEALAEVYKRIQPSANTKSEYFEREYPQHRVRITKPYYLGVYEVTVGDFRRFVSESRYKTEGEKDGKGSWGYDGKSWKQKAEYTWRNAGFTQKDEHFTQNNDEHPVVNVNWNDAVAFCKWLSKKEDRKYRLPTEAEWECACRAGSKTRHYYGDDAEGLASVGNVADGMLKEKVPKWMTIEAIEKDGFDIWTTIEANDGYVFTSPVGKFKANAFGLYDMHGNVWEWCADWYGQDYYRNSAVDDPTGPTSSSKRVHRGGAWFGDARLCRSAYRGWDTPVTSGINIGFRVALVPSE